MGLPLKNFMEIKAFHVFLLYDPQRNPQFLQQVIPMRNSIRPQQGVQILNETAF